MPKTYPFQPDYAVPPGATLKETLEAKGLSQADLAVRSGMAEKTISQIVNGIAPISCETAEKLELVLGIPASFWNARAPIGRCSSKSTKPSDWKRMSIGYRRSLWRPSLSAGSSRNRRLGVFHHCSASTSRRSLSGDALTKAMSSDHWCAKPCVSLG